MLRLAAKRRQQPRLFSKHNFVINNRIKTAVVDCVAPFRVLSHHNSFTKRATFRSHLLLKLLATISVRNLSGYDKTFVTFEQKPLQRHSCKCGSCERGNELLGQLSNCYLHKNNSAPRVSQLFLHVRPKCKMILGKHLFPDVIVYFLLHFVQFSHRTQFQNSTQQVQLPLQNFALSLF